MTVGHYGDINSMKNWINIGKPWGIGEHSMAYYGTPEQVSKYNGERAYESQEGRMEGLANECYNLIANQRRMGASYSTVFNMAWYALKPLPLGKKDITKAPDVREDGVFSVSTKRGFRVYNQNVWDLIALHSILAMIPPCHSIKNGRCIVPYVLPMLRAHQHGLLMPSSTKSNIKLTKLPIRTKL